MKFKRYLLSRTDISISTKNKYLASTRIFLKELNRIGVLSRDITVNIRCFKQDKKHKRIGLNETHISKITDRLKQLPVTQKNTRLKALFALLIFQGLRQVEIIRLNINDINLEVSQAMIQGKGKDDKEPVDLHPETIKALKEHIKTNRIADGPLFTSQSNNRKNKRLTTKSIRNIVKELLLELGINKTVHGFRHYFTTALIKEFNGNLLEVAQYTRHQSLEMLQVYNDRIKKESDLPKFYKVFNDITF